MQEKFHAGTMTRYNINHLISLSTLVLLRLKQSLVKLHARSNVSICTPVWCLHQIDAWENNTIAWENLVGTSLLLTIALVEDVAWNVDINMNHYYAPNRDDGV